MTSQMKGTIKTFFFAFALVPNGIALIQMDFLGIAFIQMDFW